MSKTKSKRIIIIASVMLIFAVLIGAAAIYLSDYYRADKEAIESFIALDGSTYEEKSDGSIVFAPSDPIAGLIFYPGGKVENDAYIPLMAALASRGILSVLVEMPFNLAVFDINAAEGIKENYPQVTDWYLSGHSLGGSMAASYLESRSDEYEGIILLGSYSTANLSDCDLKVLSAYGSEDRVLNIEKYNECRANLPEDFTELVIDGGCHAYFGMYGSQDKDGTPSISNEDQIEITANAIYALINK